METPLNVKEFAKVIGLPKAVALMRFTKPNRTIQIPVHLKINSPIAKVLTQEDHAKLVREIGAGIHYYTTVEQVQATRRAEREMELVCNPADKDLTTKELSQKTGIPEAKIRRIKRGIIHSGFNTRRGKVRTDNIIKSDSHA